MENCTDTHELDVVVLVDVVLDVVLVDVVVVVEVFPPPLPPSCAIAALRKVSMLSLGPGLTIMTMPSPQ